MKLLCETQRINRQMPNVKVRAAKATLAIGGHPPGPNAEPFIIHFTPQNKTGVRYKVKDNLVKIFTKFVGDGKATISFKEPEHDIQIKSDPTQLKCFLHIIKLALEADQASTSSHSLLLESLATTAIAQRAIPQTKLVITRMKDYPVKGFPKYTNTLKIIGLDVHKVDNQILSLRNLTFLDLCRNKISTVPKELGELRLIEIHLSENNLGNAKSSLDWNWLNGKPLRKSLHTIDLSSNKLTYFPYQLVKLQEVRIISLNYNRIKYVPFAIRRMRSLKHLCLASNKLVSLPQAMTKLNLNILNIWENKFLPREESSFRTSGLKFETFPSLLELSAEVVMKSRLPFSPSTIPLTLYDILLEAPECLCGRLSFAPHIAKRLQLVDLSNVKDLIFSRNRIVYADCVICSLKCANKYSKMLYSSF